MSLDVWSTLSRLLVLFKFQRHQSPHQSQWKNSRAKKICGWETWIQMQRYLIMKNIRKQWYVDLGPVWKELVLPEGRACSVVRGVNHVKIKVWQPNSDKSQCRALMCFHGAKESARRGFMLQSDKHTRLSMLSNTCHESSPRDGKSRFLSANARGVSK